MPKRKVAAFPGDEKKGKQIQKQKPRTPHPSLAFRAKRRHVGGDLPKNRDLSRFVKYPRYIQIQRKKRILFDRLKVPPVVNQFSFTLEKSVRKELFKLLEKYKPETKVEKKKRLKELASQKVQQQKEQKEQKEKQPKDKQPKKKQPKTKVKKPNFIKFGVNHVTALVENNAAKLVIIAHDVDPLEIVMWLPALCRTKHVPYVIVKGKAQLGALVGQKTAAVLALTNVNEGDSSDLAKIATYANESFNDSWSHLRTQWGGKKLSNKTVQKRKQEEDSKNN